MNSKFVSQCLYSDLASKAVSFLCWFSKCYTIYHLRSDSEAFGSLGSSCMLQKLIKYNEEKNIFLSMFNLVCILFLRKDHLILFSTWWGRMITLLVMCRRSKEGPTRWNAWPRITPLETYRPRDDICLFFSFYWTYNDGLCYPLLDQGGKARPRVYFLCMLLS